MARGGRTLALAIAIGAGLIAAPPASADSLVYEKDGNIWQSQPDGTDQRQITTDGGYARPTQADDGTIVAVKNQLLVRMDRGGRILNTAGDDDHGGPLVPQLSPGGLHVAYSYNNIGPTTPGLRATFSHAGRETDHDEIFQISGRGNTAWVDNERVVMFDNTSPDQDTLTYRLGDPATQTWFEDPSIAMVGRRHPGGLGPLRRHRRRRDPAVHAQRPAARRRADAQVQPHRAGRQLLPPDLGADRRRRWRGRRTTGSGWARFDLWRGVPGTTAPRLVIPGGKAPDWGPAEVSTPAAPPARHAAAGRPPATAPRRRDHDARRRRHRAGRAADARLAQPRSGALLAGLTIPVRCNEACLITAELVVDRRTARRLRLRAPERRMARATKRLTKAGSTTLRLRPGRDAAPPHPPGAAQAGHRAGARDRRGRQPVGARDADAAARAERARSGPTCG